MGNKRFQQINLRGLKTPCYIVDEVQLKNNLEILDQVQNETGCKILLALKAFSMYSMFPLIKKYLYGVCASSLNEAILGYEEFEKEVHTFSPAYTDETIKEIEKYSDYIIFNSFNQWKKYKDFLMDKKKKCGLRVNPEYSEIEVELYDPCAKHSRLGIRSEDFKYEDLSGISGLHFHAMCEQNSDILEKIIIKFEEKFSGYIKNMDWVNFGGGHHITRADYDLNLLCKIINDFKSKYAVEVYLEPGEAIALNSGILVASVLDIVNNGMDIAILDTSAETHMPDVLAMPYRPQIIGAGNPGEYNYTYRMAGSTCLAGDVIGDYSFLGRLTPGDRLIFLDMAHYTMVKNTSFNGINLPNIVVYTEKNQLKTVKEFGYKDFKSRL